MNARKPRQECPLCQSQARVFCTIKGKTFWYCPGCSGIFVDPEKQPSAEEEFERYTYHHTDLKDAGYHEFILPLIKGIEKLIPVRKTGLDYGCGARAVLAERLSEKGYAMAHYDPYFFDHKQALNTVYDFIVCCEVVEHFHRPEEEFRRLHQLLAPRGRLFIKTNLLDEAALSDFKNWWYKNDLTHVFFYVPKTFQWIKTRQGFSSLHLHKDYIILQKQGL